MRRLFASFDFSKYTKLLQGPEGINKYVPPTTLPFNYELLNFNAPNVDLSSAIDSLAAPAHDIMNRDAKLWRGAICMVVSEGLGGTAEEALPLAVVLETLHSASLVLDDVEDNSTVRRGKPCLHLIHGEASAVNIGKYMFFLPYSLIRHSNFPEQVKQKMLKAVTLEMTRLELGQGLDIQWASKNIMPSLENYLLMIECKTSIIVRLAVKLASISNRANSYITDQLVNFSEDIGAAFQIKDDLLNLESQEYAAGRSYLGEDITEGKRTAIVIRAFDQSPHRDRLVEILNKRTSDQALVKEALEIIRSTDALQWSKKLADDRIEKALASLKNCSLTRDAESFLERMATFIVARKK
mmetsp:Transcript_20262/g.37825  ORF Transcript_20262/g.37825 Transcript_20262/m.37825 type:complete len:354 (+) Transcript_20262:432-1493(+)